jgi:hypothetical protein
MVPYTIAIALNTPNQLRVRRRLSDVSTECIGDDSKLVIYHVIHLREWPKRVFRGTPQAYQEWAKVVR